MRFKSHVFRKRDSPNTVLFCVNKIAEILRDQYPEAADFLINYTIMDDLLANADSEEETIRIIDEVRKILSFLDMQAHKVICSNSEVDKALGQEVVHKKIEFLSTGDGEDKSEGIKYHNLKTLGMSWDGNTDEFHFQGQIVEEECWTKRKIVSIYSRQFDPCGLLLPYVMNGRLAFQAACVESVDWDSKLNPKGEAMKIWETFLEIAPEVADMRFQRIIRSQPKDQVKRREVHIFADASKNIMGSCAYIVTFYKDGSAESHLVIARGNVAPVIQKSLPRLELGAAVIATKLSEILNKITKIPSWEFNYWSDSYNVLYWILQNSRELPVFEANRVAAIQTASDITKWRHVQGATNPADIISRPRKPAEFKDDKLWSNDPDFLITGEYPPQKIEHDLINPDAYTKRIRVF